MNRIGDDRRGAAVRAPRLVIAAAWLLALASLYQVRLADPDLWWVLRSGGDILDAGSVHQPDRYSFTAAGLMPVNHAWLAHVTFAGAFRAGGASGLVVLKMAAALVFAGAFWALLGRRTGDDRIRLPVFVLATHAVGRFLLFRPQIFSFTALVLALLVLDAHRRTGSSRPLWLLPPLFGVWANLHGAWVVGLFVVAVVLLAPLCSRARPTASRWPAPAALAATSLATLATPFGWALWGNLGAEVLDPLNKQYVQEWQPPVVWPPDWNGSVFLMLLAVAMAAALAGRRRTWSDLLLAAVFAAAAGSSMRHIPLFAIVVTPMAAGWLDRRAAPQDETRPARLAIAAVGGLATVPAALAAAFVVLSPAPEVRVEDANYGGFPYEAVEFLRPHRGGGHLWTELAWGGYASWRLPPAWKVSIDGRNTTVFPREVVRDHLELLGTAHPDLRRLARYPVDACLIAPSRGLAAALAGDARWEEAYRDSRAVVFRSRTSRLALPGTSAATLPPRPVPLLFEPLARPR